MKKMISGEDLLLAIGDIDDDLLAYPSQRQTHYRYIKPLSIAASFIVCLSFVISFYSQVVFKGANSSDRGDDDNMNGGAYEPNEEDSPGKDNTSAPTDDMTYRSVIFSEPTEPSFSHSAIPVYENLSASCSTDPDNKITVYAPYDNGNKASIIIERSDGSTYTVTADELHEGFAEYTLYPSDIVYIFYTYGGVDYAIQCKAEGSGYYRFTYD